MSVLSSPTLALAAVALLAITSTGFVPSAISRSFRVGEQSSSRLSMQGASCEIVNSRRTFLHSVIAQTAAVGLFSTAVVGPSPCLAASGKAVDYKAVSADIAALIKVNPDWGPTLVRLAWHSSGSFDAYSKTGGSGPGTLHFQEELAHGGNAGLGTTAALWMEEVKKKYGESLSYGDLYTLAGVTAIHAMGGPVIPWSSGRLDAKESSAVTPDGRLPNADSGPKGADPSDAQHLRTVFNRMGFNDQEIVALSGAHALGRCHTNASGYDGPWTPTPTTFNNLYFSLLKSLKWTKREWDGPFQYQDGGKRLMMLPTDLVLIQDKDFSKYVDLYAKDGSKFEKDFSDAFHKLEELGTENLVPTEWV